MIIWVDCFNVRYRNQASGDIATNSDQLSTAAIVYFEYSYMVMSKFFHRFLLFLCPLLTVEMITVPLQATIILPRNFPFSPFVSFANDMKTEWHKETNIMCITKWREKKKSIHRQCGILINSKMSRKKGWQRDWIKSIPCRITVNWNVRRVLGGQCLFRHDM